MSNSSDNVAFTVSYGGYWIKNHEGHVGYVDGEVRNLECKATDLFIKLSSELNDDLYGQNIWYKLPFEANRDRKSVFAGSDSFLMMCEAAKWTGVIDVLLVDATKHPTDVEYSEPCDEEIRVERNVASVVDEDADIDYHNTPPNSEGESDEEEDFVRCKKGSGQLKLRQVFDSLEEFKEAIVDYALLGGWNIKLTRWGKEKSGAKCGTTEGYCPWYIYCSYEERIGKWMVKTFEDEHSCVKDSRCKVLKTAVIAKLFTDEIRNDPEFKPRTMQDQIQQRYNLITTIDKCKKAKKKILDALSLEHKEQFSRLKDYRLALLDSNRGSTVELDTLTNEDGSEIFRRFYICFEVLRRTWSKWCRPIFGLDGCFLKCTLKGQLLAAVGRDANNQMYPIAWAVVDVENEENWTWFIQKIKVDFNLQNGHGFTIISDRQKGLLNAVQKELPQVEHRMCARHIYGNLKKVFPRHSEMKNLFWRVAESYTQPEYDANLDVVKGYDMSLYGAIMERNPRNCSLAFCSPSASCIDVHNNISESFNNAIDPARYMPMVEMLETIRRRTMVRIDLRKKAALAHTGRFCPKPTAQIEMEQEKVKFCRMFPGSDGRCEVLESSRSFSLNLEKRTCACRRWDMSGLPCRHALRVIAEKMLNHEDYTASWYLTSRQRQIYSDSICPVNGMFFWNKSGSVVLPPPSLVEEIENRRGRKPKPKRKKGRNESPTKKKKVGREKRIMHCGRCGDSGHNIKKCNRVGVERRPFTRKTIPTREDEADSISLNYGEGPSEAQTQPSQN